MADFENMTVTELRALAKETGISGTTAMRKADLVAVLEAQRGPAGKKAPKATPKPAPKTSATAPKTALKTTAKRTVLAKDNRKAKTSTRGSKAPTVTTPGPAVHKSEATTTPAASTREVTAAKYNICVEPAIPNENLGNLPGAYAEDRLVMVPRDPDWIFIYWELTDETYQRAAQQAAGGAMVLRLYTEDGSKWVEVADVPVESTGSRYYAHAPSQDVFLVAELGLQAQGGRYALMLRSERTRIPVSRPRPGTPYFMTVPFDVPLRVLKRRGHLAGGSYLNMEGRLLTEAEYRRLFGVAGPSSSILHR